MGSELSPEGAWVQGPDRAGAACGRVCVRCVRRVFGAVWVGPWLGPGGLRSWVVGGVIEE